MLNPPPVATSPNWDTGESTVEPIVPHAAQIPLSAFVVLVVAYTVFAPNFDQPFIGWGFAGSVVFLLVAHSKARDLAATVISAAAFTIFHGLFHQSGTGSLSVSLYAGMLGRAGLIVLGERAIWASPEESRRLLRMFLLAVGIMLFVVASLLALNLTVTARPRVWDAYLYVFDGSLGFQPSFALGRIFLRYKVLADLAKGGYFGLPVVVALVSAGFLGLRSPWRPLAVLTTAGLFGYLLYWVFPAMGPIYLVGPSFPGSPLSYAALAQLHPHAITLPIAAPRNAMPSLHMAWAFLLWFGCRPLSRVARGFALTYVVLTIAATLGLGEHYLADLVVALPFAVAVQALWTPVRGTARCGVLAGTTTLTLIWLLALRYSSHYFLLTPVIPRVCVIVTTIISLAMERFLWVSQRSHPPEGDASRLP